MTENELKRCRSEFERIFSEAHTRRSSRCDDYIGEYLEVWEGFTTAWQHQQTTIDELNLKLELRKASYDMGNKLGKENEELSALLAKAVEVSEQFSKHVVILEPQARPRTGDLVEFMGEFDSIFGTCVVDRIGNNNHGYRDVCRLDGIVCPEHVFYRIIMRNGKPVVYMRRK